MANEKNTPGTIDAEALASAITAGIMATQPPRDKTYEERQREKRATDPRPKPSRPTFQNGFEINPRGLSTDCVRKLDALKPGIFLGGKVTVQDLGNGGINIRYSNATPDERMGLMALFSSFSDLVFKLHAEMTGKTKAE